MNQSSRLRSTLVMSLVLTATCPATALADDCSYTSPTDCYDQLMVAILVLALLALLVAAFWEVFLAAGAVAALPAAIATLDVGGEVAGAAELTAEAAEVTTESTETGAEVEKALSWLDRIKELNWWGGDNNCFALAKVVARIFSGEVPEFLSGMALQGATLPEIMAQMGGVMEPMSFVDIGSEMMAAGPGSQGMVAVGNYEVVNGALVWFGHIFNVINDGGAVIFLDAQAVAASADGTAVAAASNYLGGYITIFLPLF